MYRLSENSVKRYKWGIMNSIREYESLSALIVSIITQTVLASLVFYGVALVIVVLV